MKFYTLLTVLTLSSALNTVYAIDNTIEEDENYSFCSEKASRDGIVDENEKADFIQACVGKFSALLIETENGIDKAN